ncbi:MAG: AAA family ATPase [Acidimicrobiia bacterium]|nr:AAA family ATPase [Acidimicrobiia bacterium]MDH5237501.1 AAA family ATPase [Acidimicrobiia bacterium]
MTDLVADSRVIVCTGTGGVGKTTTAAAIAIEGARQGRRAVVITIDPARRLADALGLDGLDNDPARIDLEAPGELWAMMLDTKSTFDELVIRYSGDPEQAEGITTNRFYQNVSTALSGTQEYMAMEKLYELNTDERFDLLVVDTPPSRNALDFLEAPNLLTRLLDNRLYRLLTAPGRGVLRAVNTAAQTLLRQLTRVVGAEVVEDAIAFFAAFEGMEDGFKQRAQDVLTLLKSERTAFLLVASPRHDTITEAQHFGGQLHEAGITVRAAVINRMHPFSAAVSADDAEARAESATGPAASWWRALADFQRCAEDERRSVEQFRIDLPGEVELVTVPMLADDVHDLAGLEQVRAALVA